MRILIVDDNIEKIRRVHNVIAGIEGVENSTIEYAVEINKAKEHLENAKYDVMILDLFMPDAISEASTEKAGEEFIDEILGIYSINKPTEIVILSAFENCEKSFVNDEKRMAFKVLRYDEGSTQWEKSLKAIIQYRLLCIENTENRKVDYAIITTVPVETQAVKKLAEEWEKVSFDGDPLDYYVSEFIGSAGTKRVVMVQSNDMGMVSASITATNIYKHFKAKYIFVVGIAAGIGDLNYGDILVPSSVWNYTSGKYIDTNGELEFLPEPKSIDLDVKLASILQRDYSEVLTVIHDKWPTNNEIDLNIKNTKLSLCCKPLATGTAVVANMQIVKEFVLKHSRKTQGLDMEAYGVFYACSMVCNDKPIAICIKSISDFADKNKSDGYQQYASYTSASFAKYLITEVLDEMNRT